jgi:hypothetical protein
MRLDLWNMHKNKQMLVYLIALLVVVAAYVAIDLNSLGIPQESERDTIAREVAAKWLDESDSAVMQALQSALFGTGVWFRSMPDDSYVQGGVITPEGKGYLRQTEFEVKHEKIVGKVVVTVDLRTSEVAGVEPSVIAAKLVGIAPVKSPDSGSDEPIFSANSLAFGRIYFYLTGFSSLIWQMVIVGIVFGVVRGILGRSSKSSGLGVAVTISGLIAIALTGLASNFQPAFMVGSGALVVFCIAWWVTSHEARANFAREAN